MPRVPWWLRNSHLQSIYPSFPLRRRSIERRSAQLVAASHDWIIDCGAGVRLLAQHSSWETPEANTTRPLAVLLHGWEGSSESLYMLMLGQQLYERGFDVLRLNLRDHGPTHQLNRELFNSCRLPEVVGAVGAIQSRWPARSLNLVGFSLGGNFWLRVGARAPAAGLRIERIVAISPVLDPVRTLEVLESGFSIYRRYFVWKWVRSLRKKQAAWPKEYDFADILRDRTLTSMTDVLVRRYTEYPDITAYLRGYGVVGDTLSALTTPTRIIASADDPIIPVADLERLAPSPALRMTVSEHGGHCGFVLRANGSSWIADEVLRELDSQNGLTTASTTMAMRSTPGTSLNQRYQRGE
ncbi:MAG TPA: alpha/beta fold hydrolase [Steroidobacteraceae bacterium]|nr:alpha/beta fold hydrolase [Steroidobacteraceae bacterium]